MNEAQLAAAWHKGEAQRQADEDELAPILRRMYEEQRMAIMSHLSSHIEAAQQLRLEAMGIDLPEVAGHPNRRPFSGILTRIDEPSDKAPQGSGGRRVLITREAAKDALPSLIGMAVNFVSTLDNHDRKQKIGLITHADISGNAIVISGIFYADDFPAEVRKIVADQRQMGFSFDTGPFSVMDEKADPWVITKVVFTGAAVLRKASAAYTSTALAAAAAATGEDADMAEAGDKILAAIEALTGTVKTLAAAQAVTDARIEKIEKAPASLAANSTVIGMVKPHADTLGACADGMMAAGIGCHAQNGHGPFLKRMAASMMASAAEGRMPHVFSDHDYRDGNLGAAAGDADVKPAEVKTMIDEAIKAATAPLTDALAAAATREADLKAKVEKLSAGGGDAGTGDGAPARKTLAAAALTALNKFDLKPDADAGTISASAISAAMTKAGKSSVDIMAFKNDLKRNGAQIVA